MFYAKFIGDNRCLIQINITLSQVAMSLHAAILALSVGTPALGFFAEEWGLKNAGIMSEAGMPWSYYGNLVKLGSC